VFLKENRRIVCCLNDSLVFVNPFPTRKELESFYKASYFQNLDPYYRNKNVYLKYFQQKLTEIEKRGKTEGRVLDVGCSTGFFLREVKKRGFLGFGIDVSEYALKIAGKDGINVKKGTVEEVKFPLNNFNIVTSFQTIEHETNPIKFLKEIYKVLKKDGLLVITTPNYNSPLRFLMGEYWFGFRHREHLFFFNHNSLKFLLEKAGFKNIEIRRDRMRIFTFGYYMTRLISFYDNKMLKKIFLLTKKIFGNIPIPTDPFGDLVVFARK